MTDVCVLEQQSFVYLPMAMQSGGSGLRKWPTAMASCIVIASQAVMQRGERRAGESALYDNVIVLAVRASPLTMRYII